MVAWLVCWLYECMDGCMIGCLLVCIVGWLDGCTGAWLERKCECAGSSVGIQGSAPTSASNHDMAPTCTTRYNNNNNAAPTYTTRRQHTRHGTPPTCVTRHDTNVYGTTRYDNDVHDTTRHHQPRLGASNRDTRLDISIHD